MRRFRPVAVLALVAAVGSGCGDADEEANYKLVKVIGTVTRNGKPLADAKIIFIPDAGNKHSTPGGDQAGPEGNYMLKFKGRTGVTAGKYKVSVIAPAELPPGITPNGALADQPGMAKMALEAQKFGTSKSSEVKKELERSEFEADVEDKSSGVTLDFDVKSSATSASTTAT
jgi:hypothetical protein